MDHLFSVLIPKRTGRNKKMTLSRSCGDIHDLYTSKKKPLKQANLEAFGSKQITPPTSVFDRDKSMSNSELVNVVDEQLMQIREKLAVFRQQDNQFRERMQFLSDSVSELASRSSFTPSECSDLGSLDETGKENPLEEIDQQTPAFSNEPQPLRIPTVEVTGCRDHFIQPVECFHMRRATSDSAIHSYINEDVRRTLETRTYGMYGSAEILNVYPYYSNPEEINTLF